MFGAQMFAESPFAGVPEHITVRQGTGGGWSHRGSVALPKPWKGNPYLPKLPKMPKPPYLYFTEER